MILSATRFSSDWRQAFQVVFAWVVSVSDHPHMSGDLLGWLIVRRGVPQLPYVGGAQVWRAPNDGLRPAPGDSSPLSRAWDGVPSQPPRRSALALGRRSALDAKYTVCYFSASLF